MMPEKFKVHESEIPSKITIHLDLQEKVLLARMLTKYGISVDVAGDTFEHLFKAGLKTFYNERFPKNKVY